MQGQLYSRVLSLQVVKGGGDDGQTVKETSESALSTMSETLVSPEPTTFILLVLGILGLYCARKLFK